MVAIFLGLKVSILWYKCTSVRITGRDIGDPHTIGNLSTDERRFLWFFNIHTLRISYAPHAFTPVNTELSFKSFSKRRRDLLMIIVLEVCLVKLIRLTILTFNYLKVPQRSIRSREPFSTSLSNTNYKGN